MTAGAVRPGLAGSEEAVRRVHGGMAGGPDALRDAELMVPAPLSANGEPRTVVGGFTTRRAAGEPGGRQAGAGPGGARRPAGSDRWAMLGTLGLPGGTLVTARQVHGADVLVIDGVPPRGAVAPGSPSPGDVPGQEPAPEADALVTRLPGVAVAVYVADCVPVLLADPEVPIVGAAHAGWRGLAAGVVEAAVEALVRSGAARERIRAVVGPAIGPCCYEVGLDVQARVAERYPAAATTTSAGRPGLDLPLAAREALGVSGVRQAAVLRECTFETPERWFSYRRDGRTGRQYAVAAILPAPAG